MEGGHPLRWLVVLMRLETDNPIITVVANTTFFYDLTCHLQQQCNIYVTFPSPQWVHRH